MFDGGKVKELFEMLNKFISGDDRSIMIAGKIEVALDELFPEDEEVQDLITCFASYRPGGGEYLFNEEQMIKECKLLITVLQERCNTV